MSKWFRWYEGTCEDGKFRLVSRNAGVTVATVMGIWAALLEDAAHVEHRGRCERGKEFYCAILDVSVEDMDSVLSYMDDAGLLTIEGDEISITKWKERQFETDTTDGTNAERQRRFREKHKKNADVTIRNGTVTADKRPDTDTDTDKNTRLKPRSSYDLKFEEAWQAYPKRDGGNPKSPAAKRFLAAVKTGTDPQEIIDAVKRFAVAEAKNVCTPFIPQMVKWLGDQRWLDYTPGQPTSVFNIRSSMI